MRLSAEEQSRKILGVSVEVDKHWFVRSEEAVERVLSQGVGVQAFFAKNEKIVDVDNSDSDTFVAEDGRGSDDLVGHLDTNTNKDDIRVLTAVSRETRPNGGTGNAVAVSLYISSVLRLRALPLTSSTESQVVVGFFDPTTRLMSYDQLDTIFRPGRKLTVLGSKTVVNSADRRVGIRWEVDTSKMSGQRDEGSNKTGVLVRITVVLLSPKGTGLDVGETGNIATPRSLDRHLYELGVLLDHGSDNTEETGH